MNFFDKNCKQKKKSEIINLYSPLVWNLLALGINWQVWIWQESMLFLIILCQSMLWLTKLLLWQLLRHLPTLCWRRKSKKWQEMTDLKVLIYYSKRTPIIGTYSLAHQIQHLIPNFNCILHLTKGNQFRIPVSFLGKFRSSLSVF